MNKFQLNDLVVVIQATTSESIGMQGRVTDIKDGDYYELDNGNYYYKEDCLDFVYENNAKTMLIDKETYDKLAKLGILNTSVRAYNRGSSDYSQHIIQPWSIWQDWNLNPWDADIVKRILRTKQGESRILDYEKIIHICEERIRQLREE